MSSVCACECVFLLKKKNLHNDLIWSGLSLALLRSEMIGKAPASLRGDEQLARCSGPPRFIPWSEMMNWSDILVLSEFGFFSSFTMDNEYRGDSDLTTTQKLRGILAGYWLFWSLRPLHAFCSCLIVSKTRCRQQQLLFFFLSNCPNV